MPSSGAENANKKTTVSSALVASSIGVGSMFGGVFHWRCDAWRVMFWRRRARSKLPEVVLCHEWETWHRVVQHSPV